MSECVDPIVGKILAGWRYDISGLAPEMREDYEDHFDSCAHCRSRQHLHRNIDLGLVALAAFSAAVFLLAFGVILHLNPRHAFWLELAALPSWNDFTVRTAILLSQLGEPARNDQNYGPRRQKAL